jgi:hypothetical protein
MKRTIVQNLKILIGKMKMNIFEKTKILPEEKETVNR